MMMVFLYIDQKLIRENKVEKVCSGLNQFSFKNGVFEKVMFIPIEPDGATLWFVEWERICKVIRIKNMMYDSAYKKTISRANRLL